jgi:hypothetical protein
VAGRIFGPPPPTRLRGPQTAPPLCQRLAARRRLGESTLGPAACHDVGGRARTAKIELARLLATRLGGAWGPSRARPFDFGGPRLRIVVDPSSGLGLGCETSDVLFRAGWPHDENVPAGGILERVWLHGWIDVAHRSVMSRRHAARA